jgi:hypothetical protein
MRWIDIFPLYGEKLLPGKNWTTPDIGAVIDTTQTYGVPTGERNGIWCLDLDKKGDKDGIKTLTAYIVENDVADCFGTYAVQTKSGGLHLYFTLPEGVTIRNRTGFLAGCDVRGEGGFVRAGGPQYPVLQDVDPVPAPQWLVDLVTAPAARETPVSAIAISTDHPEFAHRIDMARQLLEDANPCIEGQGGDAQLWVVCCHLTRTYELPLEWCLVLLEPYNARCQPPWPIALLQRKLEEAATKGTSLPGTFPRDFCNPVAALIPPPKPMVMAGPVGAWRQKRNPDHKYSFHMAQDIAGSGKENMISQRELTASMCGPGANPDWVGVWQHDLFTDRLIAVNPPLPLHAETTGLNSFDLANIRMWYTDARGVYPSSRRCGHMSFRP